MKLRHLVPLAAALAVGATLWFLLRFSPVVPDQVARSVTANLLRERGYRLEIARVRGNPLGDLELSGVLLVAEREPPEVVARAREIQLRVQPWNLLRGRVELRKLRLLEPTVRLGAHGVRGDLLRAPAGGSRPAPPLRVRALEIVDGAVEAGADSSAGLRVEAVDLLLGLEAQEGQFALEMRRASGLVPSHGVELLEAEGACILAGDSLRLEDVEMRTSRSRLTVQGSFFPKRRLLQLSGEATPFVLAELDSLVQLPVEGQLEGPFTLARSGGKLHFTGTWNGVWRDYPLQAVDLDLVWSPRALEVRRAAGRFLDAGFTLGCVLQGEALRGELELGAFDLSRVRSDLPASALQGRGRFARRSPRDTLSLAIELQPSRVAQWSFEHLSAGVVLHGQKAWIRGGRLVGPQFAVDFSGAVESRTLSLDWEVESADVGALVGPLGLRRLHGVLRAQGFLQGPVDGLACSAAGEFAALHSGPLAATSGDFEMQVEPLDRTPRIDVEVRGKGLRLGAKSFARYAGTLSYGDGVLHVERAEASAADTLLALAGSLHSVRRDWLGEFRPAMQLDIDTALLQLGAQEIRIEEPSAVWWRERAVHVDSLRLATRGGSLRLDGGVDLGRSRIDLRTEIHAFDLALVGQLGRLRQTLAGTGTGWLEAHGSLERTQIDARLRCDSGHWNTLAFDSLRVDMQSDAFGTALRGLRLHTPHGSVVLQGRLAYLPGLSRWLTGEEGRRAPDELSHAAVEAKGELEALELARLWGALRPRQPAPAWAATVSTDFALVGTVESPRLTGQGVAHDLRLGGAVQVDSLAFAARYGDGRFELTRLEAGAAGATLLAEGRLPLALHLARRPRLVRGEELELRVQLPKSTFAAVPHFVSLFEVPPPGVSVGSVQGNLNVGGTVGKPELRGDLRVEGAGFTLKNLEEIYRDVAVSGVFAGNTLQLRELRGRSGPDGDIRGQGKVVFDGLKVADYDFSIDASKVPVFSVPEVAALASGHLNIRGVQTGEELPIPEFKGSLQILEATITKDFARDDQAASEVLERTDKPDWMADINLDAPGRVWVRNSTVDAELSGNIQLVRNLTDMDVQGTARVRRGYYGLYLERFEITRGELDFNTGSVEPELDIEARRGRPGQRIYVHLTGRPGEPRLVFTAEEREATAGLDEALITAIGDDPLGAAASTFEQMLADFEYLDSISIDQATGKTQEKDSASLIKAYNLSAGLALSDRLFVTYTNGLNESDLKRRVALEFDILRGLLLASAWEQRFIPSRQQTTDASQNAFELDLKFRYER